MKRRTLFLTIAAFIVISAGAFAIICTGRPEYAERMQGPTQTVEGVLDGGPAQTTGEVLAGAGYYKERLLHETEQLSIYHIIGDETGELLVLARDLADDDGQFIFRITENGLEKISPKLGRQTHSWGEIEDERLVLGADFYDGYFYVLVCLDKKRIVLEKYSDSFELLESADCDLDVKYYYGFKFHNGRFYVRSTNVRNNEKEFKLYICDDTGSSIPLPKVFTDGTLREISVFDVDRQSNHLVVVATATIPETGEDYSHLVRYDLESDKIVSIRMLEGNDVFNRMSIYHSEANAATFICTQNYIWKYAENNKAEILLRHGADTSYIPSGTYYALVGDNGELFTAVFEEVISPIERVYKYSFIPGEKTASGKQRLVVTANYPQPFLLTAIGLYNQQSEDYEVVLRDTIFATRDEQNQNREQAKNVLTTKILTNDVGDIVATGGMGLVHYDVFQTDAFIDLSEYLKADEKYNGLNKSFLESITIDGRIAGLPIGTIVPRLLFNQELADSLGLEIDPSDMTWSEMFTLARQIENEYDGVYMFVPDYFNASLLLEYMLVANMPDLIDLKNKSHYLRQDWFLALIEEYGEVIKLDCLVGPRIFSLDELTGDDCLFRYAVIDSFENDVRLYNFGEGSVSFVSMPSGELNSNNVAYPLIMYSISENSAHKEAAWDFLSFLLSEKTQAFDSLESVPLNIAVTERIIRDNGGMNDEEKAEIKSRYEQILDVDYMYDMDLYKQDIIGPIMEYLNGKLSRDEAIEKAEYNVWLRLNE